MNLRHAALLFYKWTLWVNAPGCNNFTILYPCASCVIDWSCNGSLYGAVNPLILNRSEHRLIRYYLIMLLFSLEPVSASTWYVVGFLIIVFVLYLNSMWFAFRNAFCHSSNNCDSCLCVKEHDSLLSSNQSTLLVSKKINHTYVLWRSRTWR